MRYSGRPGLRLKTKCCPISVFTEGRRGHQDGILDMPPVYRRESSMRDMNTLFRGGLSVLCARLGGSLFTVWQIDERYQYFASCIILRPTASRSFGKS